MSLHPIDYPTKDLCDRLQQAGIVFEDVGAWWTIHKTYLHGTYQEFTCDDESKWRLRDKEMPVISYYSVPAPSLSQLLQRLPAYIHVKGRSYKNDPTMVIEKVRLTNDRWTVGYMPYTGKWYVANQDGDTAADAVAEMLLWLHANGYLGKE